MAASLTLRNSAVSASNTHIGIGLLSNNRRNEDSRRLSSVTSETVSESMSLNAVTPSLRLRSSLSISNWPPVVLPMIPSSCWMTDGEPNKLPPTPSRRHIRSVDGDFSSREAPSFRWAIWKSHGRPSASRMAASDSTPSSVAEKIISSKLYWAPRSLNVGPDQRSAPARRRWQRKHIIGPDEAVAHAMGHRQIRPAVGQRAGSRFAKHRRTIRRQSRQGHVPTLVAQPSLHVAAGMRQNHT